MIKGVTQRRRVLWNLVVGVCHLLFRITNGVLFHSSPLYLTALEVVNEDSVGERLLRHRNCDIHRLLSIVLLLLL